jgi:hypothetical protein
MFLLHPAYITGCADARVPGKFRPQIVCLSDLFGRMSMELHLTFHT